MADRSDEDLAALLDDLERTLADLRVELDEEERRRPRRTGPLPRPPSPGEFLRFTEEYTIPTVVAVLEATIRSLELLQEVLRVANPDRRASLDGVRARGRRGNASDVAVTGVERALSELRTALSEADLPSDVESRDIVADARDLSAEIESRIRESRRRERERKGGDQRAADRSVTIGVREETTDADGDDADRDDVDEDDGSVDVDAELESIRDELGRDDADDGDEDA